MSTVSHPEHIRQMADLGDPLAIAALEGKVITKAMYKSAWEESAKYAHKLELRVQKLEKTEGHFKAELNAAKNDYDRYKKLEQTNAALLEALQNLHGAIEAVGYDPNSIIKPASLNAAEAIRKATE